MTSFRNQNWATRFKELGDEAEGIFEATYPNNWERFGLARPSIQLKDIPPFVRFTPDYLTAKGLVEVQGFGRDQILKIKLDKWTALWLWSAECRVDLFLWDTFKERYGWVSLGDLAMLLHRPSDHGITLEAFENDGNRYWAIPADALPIQWVKYDPRQAVHVAPSSSELAGTGA